MQRLRPSAILTPAVWILGAIWTTGCGHRQVSGETLRQHAIFANQDGYARKVSDDGDLLRELQPRTALDGQIAGMLDAAEARAGADAEVRLLVFVHGGLNNDDAEIDRVARLVAPLEKAGTYPVFINWPSGGGSTTTQYYFEVRGGQSYPLAVGVPTAPIFFASDLCTGAVQAPVNWFKQIFAIDAQSLLGFTSLHCYPEFAVADRNLDRLEGTPAAGDDAALPARLIRANQGGTLARKAWYCSSWTARTGWTLAYLPTLPVKMALNLLVPTTGKGSWDMMLRRATCVFHTPSEFDPKSDPTAPAIMGDDEAPATGCGDRFFRLLRARAAKRRYSVTLVGHSMGAIVLNEVLRRYDDLPIERIVYMAPACSVREAESAIVPFLERNRASQFHVLTLDPIAEVSEIVAGDCAPRGSLLTWIDNYYTSPPTPYDMRLGRWNTLLRTINVWTTVAEQVHFKAFGRYPGHQPASHGDFGDCPFWLPAFYQPDGAVAVELLSDKDPQDHYRLLTREEAEQRYPR